MIRVYQVLNITFKHGRSYYRAGGGLKPPPSFLRLQQNFQISPPVQTKIEIVYTTLLYEYILTCTYMYQQNITSIISHVILYGKELYRRELYRRELYRKQLYRKE